MDTYHSILLNRRLRGFSDNCLVMLLFTLLVINPGVFFAQLIVSEFSLMLPFSHFWPDTNAIMSICFVLIWITELFVLVWFWTRHCRCSSGQSSVLNDLNSIVQKYWRACCIKWPYGQRPDIYLIIFCQDSTLRMLPLPW